MARPKSSHPTYCHHNPKIDGKQRFFPGAYNSDGSRAAYDALIGQWLGNGRKLPEELASGVTVSTVALAFSKHATALYRHPEMAPHG
jgi:hypothetical protein